LAARHRLHEVLRGQRVVRPRLLGKRSAERDAATALHEARGRHTLGGGDQIDGALLIVLAPAPPVAALTDPGRDFLVGGQRSLRHGPPPSFVCSPRTAGTHADSPRLSAAARPAAPRPPAARPPALPAR